MVLSQKRTGRPSLRKRLEYAARGEADSRFVSWLGAAFGFDPADPPASLGLGDKLVPWLYREWQNNPRLVPRKVLPIRDWWAATRQDLGQFTFAEADRAQRAWHRELAKQRKRAEIAVGRRGSLALSLADGSTWYRVARGTTDRGVLKALQEVGKSLGHCYARASVLKEYLRDNDLYTLYDGRGEPHVTAAVKDGKIVEARRTEDVAVEYESKWAPHVVTLVESRLQWSAAVVPLAPEKVLARLAGDENSDVRWAVARNPRTSPAVLARLAGDENSDVRWAVAENPRTSPAVLTRLAGDENSDVRRAVARNLQARGLGP